LNDVGMVSIGSINGALI